MGFVVESCRGKFTTDAFTQQTRGVEVVFPQRTQVQHLPLLTYKAQQQAAPTSETPIWSKAVAAKTNGTESRGTSTLAEGCVSVVKTPIAFFPVLS